MSRNPRFDAYLEHMHEIHEGKNADYSDDSNPYSNFEGTAELTGLTTEQVFHVQLGNKMERLRQLMSGKEPNHESLDDTILDLAVYAALWGSWRGESKGITVRLGPRWEVHAVRVGPDYGLIDSPQPDCPDKSCIVCNPRAEITD